jgi:hypothetical protein
MASKDFIHCPNCGSDDIGETDYEIENDEGELIEDKDGRCCNKCHWEGDVSELVAVD